MTTTPVTIEQAAAILGVSASTIRRRIKAGTLRVEEARRPQGVVWLVHLPAGTAPAAATATADTAPVATTATTVDDQAAAIATVIQTTISAVLAPLVSELAAQRQANERQAETIRAQAEQIGALTERLAAATPSESPTAGRTATESAGTPQEPPGALSALWSRWWLALAALAFLTAALALLWTR